MSSVVKPTSAPSTSAPSTSAPSADRTARALAFCRAYTLHAATVARDPKSVCSRIARALNTAEGLGPRDAYFTGADVSALMTQHGVTIPN